MGNCRFARLDNQKVQEISSIPSNNFPNIQLNCQQKVLIEYIKKHLFSHATKEQKSKLVTVEKLMNELSQSCKNLQVAPEVYIVLFQSIYDEIKLLKRRIQNKWKSGLSDYDSFLLKLHRENIPKLDLFNIIDIPKSCDTPPTLDDLKSINFPILSHSNNTLMYLTGLVMKNAVFAVEHSVKSCRIDSFIETICINYNITSYHNFSHAFSVFLLTYQTYTMSSEISDCLSTFEFFFLLVAGIAHDLNHKGKNNAYHIKKRSRLAVVYSDQSVLENMHLSTLFRIMAENPEADLLSTLKDAAVKTRAKKILAKCILATDMTTHFSSLKEFKQKCDVAKEASVKSNDKIKNLVFQKERQSDRDFVMEMIIHACDIGNPCLETKNYLNWAALLTHEFDQQNKKETLYGLEITPMLQYTDKSNFYKGQTGFCRLFVLPLWKQMSTFSPGLNVFTSQVEENIRLLEQSK